MGLAVCQRMPACRPTAFFETKLCNYTLHVPLAFVNVYQRMGDIFHKVAYASTICCSVTPSSNSSLIKEKLQ